MIDTFFTSMSVRPNEYYGLGIRRAACCEELKTLISRLFVGREPALAQMVHIILDRCAPVLKKIYLK